MFFFNRRLVGTLCQPNGVFFLFFPQTGGYFFPYPEKDNFEENKNTGRFFFRPDIIKYLSQMAMKLY